MKQKLSKDLVNSASSPKELYIKIADLLQRARQNVVRTINQTMVYTYFEIGRLIVEDEQQGKERAEYGKQVLEELALKLSSNFGKDFSIVNLRQMRSFYLVYSIQQTTSAEFENLQFLLSWSHYLKLMRIKNPDERRFYEIECAANNWSLKEFQRQFDSALYERLALSRDKEGIKQLAEKGQVIEKPLDIIKDPYILEFLNLPAFTNPSALQNQIIPSYKKINLPEKSI